MCIIAFAVSAHPSFPLVVIANRDELYARPTQAAHAWADAPGVFAGRDLDKGGTWLGVTPSGRFQPQSGLRPFHGPAPEGPSPPLAPRADERSWRFAAVTNVRNPAARREGKSRGALVREALVRDADPATWSRALDRAAYPAFNLLLGDGRELFYATEESDGLVHVAPGVHALSNARLDVSWPKTEAAKVGLTALLAGSGPGSAFDVDAAFALLAVRDRAGDDALPRTGVPLDLERALSPAFLAMESYGTRASTVVVFGRCGSVRLAERTWGPGGALVGEVDVVLARE